ncbi:MAG: YihY/virulence factor BrkB family protein, partial [Opitutales bacterium]|nr:YihY/virulence factor BrkB family protein [Opitutales bacterium]
FGIVMILLSAFYKFMPNTKVNWFPALVGSFFVSALLFINHYLSFLYAQRVITTGNLYGSVSIVLVFMLGLYVFWVIVLLGGQVTYSVQNVNNLANQRAWDNMSIRSRKALCLASMILTARRFLKRESPPTSGELSSALHVPSQVMNSCLNTLCEMNWLAPIESLQDEAVNETRFQPSRPLDESTIHDFEVDFFNLGNNAGAEAVIGQSPLLSRLLPDDALQNPDYGQIPISRLLAESPEAFPSSKH